MFLECIIIYKNFTDNILTSYLLCHRLFLYKLQIENFSNSINLFDRRQLWFSLTCYNAHSNIWLNRLVNPYLKIKCVWSLKRVSIIGTTMNEFSSDTYDFQMFFMTLSDSPQERGADTYFSFQNFSLELIFMFVTSFHKRKKKNIFQSGWYL